MIEKWERHELLKDMSNIIDQDGFMKIDELCYKTMRPYLTDTRESKNNSKATDKVWTFEKV